MSEKHDPWYSPENILSTEFTEPATQKKGFSDSLLAMANKTRL
ncbi:MAG TPA: hypothetical protein VL327_11910 [Pyrinomonadaceae bacterium]|jgi:hypothetical protein|nr:hypothetical protein [Pyrinomonadaceae bacterium]